MRNFRSYQGKTNAAGERLQGRYRTVPASDHGAMAYVINDGIASYIPEVAYRQKKYLPAFDELPTEDEYDR